MRRLAMLVLLSLAALPAYAGEEGPVTAADTQTPPAPPPGAEPKGTERNEEPGALQPIYRNGFFLRTADRKNELRIAASVQLDARGYFGDSVAPSSLDIRRARLDFQGKVQDWITFRIQAAMEDSPYIRNAFFDLRWSEGLHLQVGQMKVPFSTSWLTQDNQVNFLERGTARPVYPFFDRGVIVWGDLAHSAVTYNLGAFNGSGVDLDTPKGDVDDYKEVVARLFTQPWRNSKVPWLQGLYLVGEGTYSLESVPSKRYETSGMTIPTYESLMWRWRTEQLIGSDGRNTDQIAAESDSRRRWGLETHYLKGPFAASAEYLQVRYDGLAVYHEFWAGSKRLRHDPVLEADGAITSLSIWASYFLTGEAKDLSNSGWRQPNPKKPFVPGGPGAGAWEVLARVSRTTADRSLFRTAKVRGFASGEVSAPAVGSENSVTAAVLDGAWESYEATLGLNWTLNPNLRVQVDVTTVWAPDFANGAGGIVSGGSSNMSDLLKKNRQVKRENEAGLRFIFKI